MVIERFTGDSGLRRLAQALEQQVIVAGSSNVAARLAQIADLYTFVSGKAIIEQGAFDNDLYFLLSGSVRILVNGRDVATREAGVHFGEMAMIDPGSPRTASVFAKTDVLVAKISESEFIELANEHPAVWRSMTLVLSDRLNQRRKFHNAPNIKPRVFIGSSTEGLTIAQHLHVAINGDDQEAILWSNGVFGVSHYPIDDLASQLEAADFAVLVTTPDDVVFSREQERMSPRDNVVFELGFFMGSLSRERTMIVAPKAVDLKFPSDMLGLTLILYEMTESDLSVMLTPACTSILHRIKELGVK